jgi:hypothetical protein
VHPPPAQLAGFVSPVSLDAAPLCFDAAYDAPGTATIAANATAATTLIFKLMKALPPGQHHGKRKYLRCCAPTPRNMLRCR